MEFGPVFFAFLAVGCAYAFFAGQAQGRVYYAALIEVRSRIPGWRGWVLVGALAFLSLVLALLLLLLPSIVIFVLIRTDRAAAKFSDVPFMTAMGAMALPFFWGVNRMQRRFADRLNALGLRFN